MPAPLLRAAMGETPGKLPDPFPGLAGSAYRVQFRRGELCMLAGPPGSGKTTVALIAALRAAVPCLYFSADSNEQTMAARAAAAITRHPISTVEEVIKHGLFSDYYGTALGGVELRFSFDSEPSMADIAASLAAWAEVRGDAPHLIVVDNLLNLQTEMDEWGGLRQACKDLHWLARTTRACVLVLHHTSEQDQRHITSAPPRSAIQGKVSQLPSLILTTAQDQGVLWLAVVKNRHGDSDPHAQRPLRWGIDFPHCQIYDSFPKGWIVNDAYNAHGEA